VRHRYDSEALLSATAARYASMAQWVSSDTEQTTACCRVCQYPVGIRFKFYAFKFSAQPTINIVHTLNVQLENHVQRYYSLAAVINYSYDTQIITRDGRVWFMMECRSLILEPALDCVGPGFNQ
jgi:hypothetical protein